MSDRSVWFASAGSGRCPLRAAVSNCCSASEWSGIIPFSTARARKMVAGSGLNGVSHRAAGHGCCMRRSKLAARSMLPHCETISRSDQRRRITCSSRAASGSRRCFPWRALHAASSSFALHYFGRSSEATAFRDVPQSEGFGQSASVLVRLDPAQVADQLRRAVAAVPPGTHCYICGPVGLIDCAMVEAAHRLPADAIHREVFTAALPTGAQTDQPFVIRPARSGMDVPVPAGVSIVAALAASGIEVPVSCEQGVCGTCVTTVLDGEPDHRDSFPMDHERAAGDTMTLCVSRARSALLVSDL